MTDADERKLFQGTWKQIAYERDGRTESRSEEAWSLARFSWMTHSQWCRPTEETLIKGTFKFDLA
jgi:hypothetical protein